MREKQTKEKQMFNHFYQIKWIVRVISRVTVVMQALKIVKMICLLEIITLTG